MYSQLHWDQPYQKPELFSLQLNNPEGTSRNVKLLILIGPEHFGFKFPGL